MKKNDDNKYIRIGIFAVAFLLGLFVSIIEKNGWLAFITFVVVPLLYIPYGISDWKRRKQDNPPEKQNKPAKTAAAEAPVKKENTSEPPGRAISEEKTFTLLGSGRGLGYGTSAWMRQTDKGFEVIVEYHAPTALANIQQRLNMMCKGTLKITPREGGGTVVKVTIPNTKQ